MTEANGKVTSTADPEDQDTLEVKAIGDTDVESDGDEDQYLNDTDNVGESSVEINVDDLIAEMEAEGLSAEELKNCSSRRRIDEVLEQRRMSEALLDSYDFEFE